MASDSRPSIAGSQERLRDLANAARERLRRLAADGDQKARRALEDLGETVPPVPHWSETGGGRDEDDEGGR